MLSSPANTTRSSPEEREERVEGSVTRIREFQTIHSPENKTEYFRLQLTERLRSHRQADIETPELKREVCVTRIMTFCISDATLGYKTGHYLQISLV